MARKQQLVEFQITLSQNQIRKLKKGQPVRIKNSHIGVGQTLLLGEKKARTLKTAQDKGIGKQLTMTQEELEGSGLLDKIKRGFQKVGREISKGYKDHIKDTKVGEVIRKGIREGVSRSIKALPAIASTAISMIPGGTAVAPIAKMGLEKLTDKFADEAGRKLVEKSGLGLRSDLSKAFRATKNYIGNGSHHSGHGLRSDLKTAYRSTRDYLGSGVSGGQLEPNQFAPIKKGILAFDHPAMRPPLPMKDMSGSGMYRHHGMSGKGMLPPGY